MNQNDSDLQRIALIEARIQNKPVTEIFKPMHESAKDIEVSLQISQNNKLLLPSPMDPDKIIDPKQKSNNNSNFLPNNNQKKKKSELLQEPEKKKMKPFGAKEDSKKHIGQESDSSNDNYQKNQITLENNKKITQYFQQIGQHNKKKTKDVSPKTKSSPNYKSGEDVSQQSIQTILQPPSNDQMMKDLKKTQEEMKSLSQKLNEKQENEKRLNQQLNQLNEKLQQTEEKNQQMQKKVNETLIVSLKTIEEHKRREVKKQLMRMKEKLGEQVQRRSGVSFYEEWEDGYEIKLVKAKLQEISQLKEDLEKKKKQLKQNNQIKTQKDKMKLSTDLINENSNNSAGILEQELSECKQRIGFQLSTLSREEEEYKKQLSRLEEEKFVFIWKLKRFNEELSCKYSRDCPQSNQKAWPLLNYRYQVLSLLGRGGFSEVYKGFDLLELREVACKIHQLNPQWSEQAKANYIRHALRENHIHQNLKHPNIVQLIDTVEINSDSFCTVLEYCSGVDLSFYLKKNKTLSEREARDIIKQILSALIYMHSQSPKVIHYDIKPQNIMFHQGNIKISDFGLCKIMEHDQTRLELTSQGLGTYWYLPPECFLNENANVSTKVDVWSLGVMFYEMVYGQRPFGHGMSQERVMKDQVILNAQLQFPQQKSGQKEQINVSNDCKEFIKKCLQRDQNSRWESCEAYASPYMYKKL